MPKITVDISEIEIQSLEACVGIAENEGYTEDDANEVLRKIHEAFQQSVRPIASPIVNGTYSFRCDPHRVGKSGMQTTGES